MQLYIEFMHARNSMTMILDVLGISQLLKIARFLKGDMIYFCLEIKIGEFWAPSKKLLSHALDLILWVNKNIDNNKRCERAINLFTAGLWNKINKSILLILMRNIGVNHG